MITLMDAPGVLFVDETGDWSRRPFHRSVTHFDEFRRNRFNRAEIFVMVGHERCRRWLLLSLRSQNRSKSEQSSNDEVICASLSKLCL